jgi:hypothetical protein
MDEQQKHDDKSVVSSSFIMQASYDEAAAIRRRLSGYRQVKKV